MTKEDRKILKHAKKAYKDLKSNPVRFKETRDEIIKSIVTSEIPKWGSIKVGFLN